ncbi:DoxX family protein [Amycolatopsis sp. H20-H5]|uniref:DoxX family protein n=1 Tax=Amycolatopsis sp. H20-H5 TaxID=3046309 RepID=UPI002DB82100|nr:DoxX family protein [Amycolatopsis sp. H20-H5]MEC3977110.1 DoxX family protein [Amycolatopsis sp. H20-H5]
MTVRTRFESQGIAAFRVVIGFLFFWHGASTLFAIPASGKAIPDFGAWPGWWAAAIQLTGGALVALGLGTRVAALLGSGSMAYAYFVVHQPKALLPIANGGEASALFCWALLLIAITGPGAYALSGVVRAARQAKSLDAVPGGLGLVQVDAPQEVQNA